MDKCFECDSENDIHYHHVIPRTLGGVKTIPLCCVCHGKVHGLDFTKHGTLIKLGLANSTKIGGQPRIGKELQDNILKMKAEGLSNRAIGRLLNISHSTVGLYAGGACEVDIIKSDLIKN